MIRKVAFGVISAVLLFSFTACGAEVTSGEITEKNYTEAYITQEEIMEQECEKESYYTGTGSKRKKHYRTECESVGTGEFEDVEHPAKYEFELTNDEGDTGTVSVSQEVYDSYDVGDFYDGE